MENNTISRFRWFWAWQDGAEEQWLTEMARQGWHLSRIFMGRYTFSAGAPGEYVYRLDFRNELNQNLKDYYQLFHEAGWEQVTTWGGWQYWRKLAEPGEEPEIYTDNASKIEKYRRLLAFLVVPLALNVINLNNLLLRSDRLPPFLIIFFAAVLLLLVYAIARVWMHMRALQKNL